MSTSRVSGPEQPGLALRVYTIYQAARRSIVPPTLLGGAGAVLVLALLLLPPMPWNMRLPCYLLLFIWTLLRPRLALYLAAFAVPWGSLDYINVSSLRLNSADILVIFLAFAWLMSLSLPSYAGGGRDRTRGQVPPYLITAVILLLGVMFLSLAVALNKKDSLKEISKWVEFFVLLLLGTQYLRTRQQVWILVTCIIGAAITQAFFGYAQAIFDLGPQSFVRGLNLRVYGTFAQPNPYAGYLNISLAIALSLLFLGRGGLTRAVAGIAACLIGGAFYLTQSRGGLIALMAALVVIILVGLPSLRTWMRIGVIGLLILVGGFVDGLFPLSLFNQVNHFLGLSGISLSSPTAADFSTAERLAHWIAGIHMYLDHPLLGVGIGNYPDAYAGYQVTIFVNSLGQAHNYYINIAAETGTIGLLVYLFFVASILTCSSVAVYQISKRRLQLQKEFTQPPKRIPAPLTRHDKLLLLSRPTRFIAYYRRQNCDRLFSQLTNDRALVIGLLAANITICVHNLVDDLYDHSLTNLMALLLVALISLQRITRENNYQEAHTPLRQKAEAHPVEQVARR